MVEGEKKLATRSRKRMSDVSISVSGVIGSLIAGYMLWYSVEDELERKWHEKRLRQISKRVAK